MQTKINESVQSDGSDGEIMSENNIELIQEAKSEKTPLIDRQFMKVFKKQIDGNTLRSATAVYRQERKNSRRKNPVVNAGGVIQDVKIFKSETYHYEQFLNTLDKTDRPRCAKLSKNSSGQIMSTEIIPVDHASYIQLNVPRYIEIHNEFKVFDSHVKSGIPLLIQGPKGIGKTLGIAKYAEKKRCPIIEFDCSEGTKKYDLQGTKTGTSNGGIAFELGFIPRIIECANQFGMAILVLEELNALTPAIQKLLNPMLDWRKGMFIPETGKHYKLDEGVKLGIFGTTNPASYQASNDLNEDLQSRFSIWKWGYPNARQERKAIEWNGIDASIQKAIMLLAKNSRDLVERQTVSYALSTRDIQKFVDDYVSYEDVSITTLRMCLDMNVLSFYDDVQEIDTIKSRIESAFGSNVFTAKEGEDLIQSDEDEIREEQY